MTILYVASDRPGAGKTALCASMAYELRQRGKTAVVFKPASTSDGDDPDFASYEKLLGGSQSEGDSDRSPDIGATISRLAEQNDVVLVEGMSSATDDEAAKLAEALDARVVVVAQYDAEVDTEDLAVFSARFGDRLVGFVINGLTRYQGTAYKSTLAPAMEARGLVRLGAIPEDRRLLGVTVGELVAQLDGKYLNGSEPGDGLVEHVLVGGLGLDSGEAYFGLRQNKAVVIRGDRPDIQMAALATPTACMLLANGIEPIEYVLNEAELEEVPLISVQPDTLTTMELMKGLSDRARFDHPAKLERFVELMNEHVDIGLIYAALGLSE